MSEFNIDLTEVSDIKPDYKPISPEELEEITKKFKAVKLKVSQNEELTLVEQKIVIQHCRAIRKSYFSLAINKPKVISNKPKKLARIKMLEFYENKDNLSEIEEKSLEYSLALYKGKKLTKTEANRLLIKKGNGKELSTIEKKDLHKTFYGDLEYDEERL